MPLADVLQHHATALAVGLIVGIERERRRRGGVDGQIAGSRSFALLALAGSVAAQLDDVLVAVGLGVVGALLVAGYATSPSEDRGTTTEIAALLTYLVGALVWHDARVAVAVGVVLTVVLASKERLHRFAREQITALELEDALKLFVVAFVVLPLLPDRALGPYGVLNPSRVWTLVVALSAISSVGYVLVRWLGAGRGLAVAGLAGGFVSASATTASMARTARVPHLREGALLGAAAASVTTIVYAGMVVGFASPEVLEEIWPVLAVSAVLLLAELAVIARRAARRTAASPPAADPTDDAAAGSSTPRAFALLPALGVAALLTLVRVVARWGSDELGSSGAVLAGTVAGFADAHGAIIAMVSLVHDGALSSRAAIIGSAGALAANTVTKVVLAATVGGRSFAVRFGALLAVPYLTLLAGLVLVA